MTTIHDVPVNDLVERVAKELIALEAVKAPPWAVYAKTGAHKERAPTRQDWWQVRAAAVLRKISVQGPIGVSKLRRHYGGKRNMGMAPERVFKGSGAIIRKILQQLDKAGLTKHTKIGLHAGRIITPKGKSLLDKTSTLLAKELGISIKPSLSSETENHEGGQNSADEHAVLSGTPSAPEAGEEKGLSRKKSGKKVFV